MSMRARVNIPCRSMVPHGTEGFDRLCRLKIAAARLEVHPFFGVVYTIMTNCGSFHGSHGSFHGSLRGR